MPLRVKAGEIAPRAASKGQVRFMAGIGRSVGLAAVFRGAAVGAALLATCGDSRDPVVSCTDWASAAGAAPAVGTTVVARSAAWASADRGGAYLAYRSGGRLLVRRMATGEERELALAASFYAFPDSVDRGRLVAFRSEPSVGEQEYFLVDFESCRSRPLGIRVSTTDPVLGFSRLSALSLAGDRLFYAISRGALAPAQQFVLDLVDLTRRASAVTVHLVTEAQLDGDRVVWLHQKDGGGGPGVLVWNLADDAILSIDLPPSANPQGLSFSGTRAAWTDYRNASTSRSEEVYVLDVATGAATPLTGDLPGRDQPSILGRLVAWSDNRAGNFDIRIRDLDSGEERAAVETPDSERSPVLTASGLFWQVPGLDGATVHFDPGVHP